MRSERRSSVGFEGSVHLSLFDKVSIWTTSELPVAIEAVMLGGYAASGDIRAAGRSGSVLLGDPEGEAECEEEVVVLAAAGGPVRLVSGF